MCNPLNAVECVVARVCATICVRVQFFVLVRSMKVAGMVTDGMDDTVRSCSCDRLGLNAHCFFCFLCVQMVTSPVVEEAYGQLCEIQLSAAEPERQGVKRPGDHLIVSPPRNHKDKVSVPNTGLPLKTSVPVMNLAGAMQTLRPAIQPVHTKTSHKTRHACSSEEEDGKHCLQALGKIVGPEALQAHKEKEEKKKVTATAKKMSNVEKEKKKEEKLVRDEKTKLERAEKKNERDQIRIKKQQDQDVKKKAKLAEKLVKVQQRKIELEAESEESDVSGHSDSETDSESESELEVNGVTKLTGSRGIVRHPLLYCPKLSRHPGWPYYEKQLVNETAIWAVPVMKKSHISQIGIQALLVHDWARDVHMVGGEVPSPELMWPEHHKYVVRQCLRVIQFCSCVRVLCHTQFCFLCMCPIFPSFLVCPLCLSGSQAQHR